ncbi:hypothetical protein BAY60_06610 [Prauserella muralis]|uniref:Uncharacterized protein n=1 Tax=Prauserella muralis TaxID=588067 RepID=A0A2V4BBN9_9PSEU|nr:hypothetical protein BAY60_06610 [Prauserella muralis]
MAGAPAGPRSLGSRLQRARTRRFVGRTAERELFAAALAADQPPFAVLHLYGPGGVGKSALLGQLRRTAEQAGRHVVAPDLGHVPVPGPAGYRDAVESALSRSEGGTQRIVVFDDLHWHPGLETWLREDLLPSLPEGDLVLLAGRTPLSEEWHADAGWRELLRSISLRNLDPEEARGYAEAEGLPRALSHQVADLTHGHPLALGLLVDAVRRADEQAHLPASLTELPDLVRVLLNRLLDEAPTKAHRIGLHVLGHAAITTEALLRAVVEESSERVFGWLRSLSFVDETPQGLRPHDLARDVLDADLRWRDAETHAEIHRRVRRYLLDRVQQLAEPDRIRIATEVLFLIRRHPAVEVHGRWDRLGLDDMAPIAEEHFPAVIELTRAQYGRAEADRAAHWLERQPGAFRVFRDDHGDLLGYAGYLNLDAADEADINADPGTRALWEFAQRHRPPLPGQAVKALRFLVERGITDDRRMQRTGTLTAIWCLIDILARPATAWDFLTTYTDLEYWQPFMRYLDYHREPDAEFDIGGRHRHVFAHDWRRVGVAEWLDLTAAQETGAPPPDTGSAPEVALSQVGFAEAVRRALADLRNDDRLAANPLTRTALVLRGAAEPSESSAERLRSLVIEAAESLRGDPRTENLHRVIDRTWLRPAPTQEKAAELLGLPFSTYRRHRNRGVELVTEWLWQRELTS